MTTSFDEWLDLGEGEMFNMDENYVKLLQLFTWEQVLSGEIFDSWVCSNCGERQTGDGYKTVHDGRICEYCYNYVYFRCDRCEQITHTEDGIITRQGVHVCDDCASSYYYHCDDCGDWVDYNHAHTDTLEHTYCDRCRNSYYRCDDCGCFVHEDDVCSNDNGCYCEDCIDSNPDDDECDSYGIHEYGYRPDLDFKGEGKLFFGTELEIDNGDRGSFKFDSLSDNFYCCNDGSLDDEGFEIISHPMSYEWIMENTPFKDVVKLCKDAGFKSHDTTTCGFHIHMSRTAFSDASLVETDARITSFILFFEKFWDKIVTFSRRKYDKIEHYAARICDSSDEVTHVEVCKKKNEKRYERYHCVNLSNSDTIEVRIFRGSLIENTLIAAIQLCKLFYELSVFDAKVIEKMKWEQIKLYAETDYPELLKYMETRGL